MTLKLDKYIQCPKCQRLVTVDTLKISCFSCGELFFKQNGVWKDLEGTGQTLPPFYRNANWEKYQKNQSVFHRRYYCESNVSSRLEYLFKKNVIGLVDRWVKPVLDFGCGNGMDLEFFPHLDDVIAVDLHFDTLCQAARRHKKPVYFQSDIASSMFKLSSFQTILAFDVLEHVFALDLTVQSLANILHPEGFMYVLIPTEGGLASFCRKIYTAPKYSKMFGYDYADAMKYEHCNSCFAVEDALKKWFIIDEKKGWPSPTTDSLTNLVWAYRLRKRV